MAIERIKMTNRALSRFTGEYYATYNTTQDVPDIVTADVTKNLDKLVTIFAEQINELECDFDNLYTLRWIDTIITNDPNLNLDILGQIVGISRPASPSSGPVTDDLYRVIIKAKAAKNASRCTFEELIEQIELILSLTEPVVIVNLGNANAQISFLESDLSADEKDLVLNNDLLPRATGVNYIYVEYTAGAFSVVDEASPATLPIPGGLGFDDENAPGTGGQFATEL